MPQGWKEAFDIYQTEHERWRACCAATTKVAQLKERADVETLIKLSGGQDSKSMLDCYMARLIKKGTARDSDSPFDPVLGLVQITPENIGTWINALKKHPGPLDDTKQALLNGTIDGLIKQDTLKSLKPSTSHNSPLQQLDRLQEFWSVSRKLRGQSLAKVVMALHRYPTDRKLSPTVTALAAERELWARYWHHHGSHIDDHTYTTFNTTLDFAKWVAIQGPLDKCACHGLGGGLLGLFGYAFNQTGECVRALIEEMLGNRRPIDHLSFEPELIQSALQSFKPFVRQTMQNWLDRRGLGRDVTQYTEPGQIKQLLRLLQEPSVFKNRAGETPTMRVKAALQADLSTLSQAHVTDGILNYFDLTGELPELDHLPDILKEVVGRDLWALYQSALQFKGSSTEQRKNREAIRHDLSQRMAGNTAPVNMLWSASFLENLSKAPEKQAIVRSILTTINPQTGGSMDMSSKAIEALFNETIKQSARTENATFTELSQDEPLLLDWLQKLFAERGLSLFYEQNQDRVRMAITGCHENEFYRTLIDVVDGALTEKYAADGVDGLTRKTRSTPPKKRRSRSFDDAPFEVPLSISDEQDFNKSGQGAGFAPDVKVALPMSNEPAFNKSGQGRDFAPNRETILAAVEGLSNAAKDKLVAWMEARHLEMESMDIEMAKEIIGHADKAALNRIWQKLQELAPSMAEHGEGEEQKRAEDPKRAKRDREQRSRAPNNNMMLNADVEPVDTKTNLNQFRKNSNRPKHWNPFKHEVGFAGQLTNLDINHNPIQRGSALQMNFAAMIEKIAAIPNAHDADLTATLWNLKSAAADTQLKVTNVNGKDYHCLTRAILTSLKIEPDELENALSEIKIKLRAKYPNIDRDKGIALGTDQSLALIKIIEEKFRMAINIGCINNLADWDVGLNQDDANRLLHYEEHRTSSTQAGASKYNILLSFDGSHFSSIAGPTRDAVNDVYQALSARQKAKKMLIG
ncbi:hypothetical protein AWB78_08437 [Caballeronia calidae]|uniref:Uncharacterized protein n=2 Tax=Caballeronia calidae TaxID=1777139 RepID=A0A158EMI0_9BURK|nr:hypothetical protein AWB78_08437 [Caballeronia calidae]